MTEVGKINAITKGTKRGKHSLSRFCLLRFLLNEFSKPKQRTPLIIDNQYKAIIFIFVGKGPFDEKSLFIDKPLFVESRIVEAVGLIVRKEAPAR